MRFTLKPVSASTYEIKQGSRKVGFVRTCPAGFVAHLGQHCETASSVRAAFDKVAVKALGFDSVAALNQHNQRVAAKNAENRARAYHAVDQALNHRNDPLTPWGALSTDHPDRNRVVTAVALVEPKTLT